jgi:dephospho-CoA kinase
MIVGITGGIACGKTEAGKVLMGMGVPVLDADEVAHYISNYEPAVKSAVRTAFGDGAFSDNGLLNRKALGAVVFSDPAARAKLERIFHPRIKEILQENISQSRALGLHAVISAPLLIEANFQDIADVIWVISSDERLQVKRLRDTYGLSEIEAFRRINAQLPLREKEAYAHYILRNNGSLEEFHKTVRETWERTLSEHAAI